LTFLTPVCLIIHGITSRLLLWEGGLISLNPERIDSSSSVAVILSLLGLEFILFNLFTVTSYLSFYIFFELSLVPTYLLIAILGARVNKIKAAFYLLFYTLLGSLFFIIPLIYLIYIVGVTDISAVAALARSGELAHFHLIYLSLFLALAIKVPLPPLHIWLPEAHVEASTEGSVVLAGLLLKIGGYGLIRLLLIPFPFYTLYFQPLIFAVAIIGVFYTSLLLLAQFDLKKIIAYYSIVHMNFALLGLYSGDILGIQGGIYIILTHGITSSILFIFVGYLYMRYHTRAINFYRGLINTHPVVTFFFFLFILGNLPFPGTGGFNGELLVFASLLNMGYFYPLILLIPSIVSAVYSFYLFTRLSYGTIQPTLYAFPQSRFLEETLLFSLFVIWIFLTGLFPAFLMDSSLAISELCV
jgi:NADH-quinone oxidoreductase subunit M